MPKSFQLREGQRSRSNTPTSNTSVRVEVGVNEVELSKRLANLEAELKTYITDEFTKLKAEIQAKGGN
jgi:hypothetical protein